MNILLLSCGTRNKIVQYFRNNLNGQGKIIATDCSELAPALYEADEYYIMPKMSEDGYLEKLIDLCSREKVRGILSLIDPELSLLSKNAEEFTRIGVDVIGSSYQLCEMSLDKYQMYEWLVDHNYNCAKTWMNKNEFLQDIDRGVATYPVFVKPAKGSASISISKVFNRETVELLFANEEGLIIQEFLDGKEIGADVYIDMITGKVVSIFTKEKIKMRSGETDKSVSIKDEKLFLLIEKFVEEAGFKGQIDIDIFNIHGQYFVSEVNPRFGGGYPHAYEQGVNHINLIIENLKGNRNVKQIGNYDAGVYMMKYNEVKII